MNKHSAINVLFTVALMCLFFLHHGHPVDWYWFALLLLLYLAISSIGSYFIRLNYFTHSYSQGRKDKKQIAITFDDGPNEYTAQVLNILSEENVPATFFCIGSNISGREALLKRIDSEGHLIGNHSFDHKHTFPLQSGSAIALEIGKCADAICSLTGKKPRFFRPPFGVTDPMVAAGIRRSGVHSIGWSLRSYDTVIKDADKLLAKVSAVSDGDIVLFHEAGLQTTAILSQFIENVRAKGFEIVPLDQLLGIDAYEK